MKIYKISALILLSFLGLQNAFSQINEIDSSKLTTLRMDINSARGVPVSTIFEKVNFIPLETTKDSFFGSIRELKVTKSHFLIYDFETGNILVFYKSGKFRSKIKAKADAGDDSNNGFKKLYSFGPISYNGEEAIQLLVASKKLIYNYDGKLLEKGSASNADLSYGYNFDNNLGHVNLNYTDIKINDGKYFELAVLKENQVLKKYFPFTLKKFTEDDLGLLINPLYKSGLGDEFFFLRPYDLNIYTLTPEKLYLSYKFIFTADHALPTDFLTNSIYKKKRSQFVEENPKVVYKLSNIYGIGNQLYFKCIAYKGLSGNDSFVYNLKNQKLISINHLEPDATSQYLPITDDGFGIDFINSNFNAFDGEYLYTNYSSLAMFTFKEQTEHKRVKYDEILSKYFKTQNRKSNPVIIQLKPRK